VTPPEIVDPAVGNAGFYRLSLQVLGGVGYTRDFRFERCMREAKIAQTVEAPIKFSAW
jgi:hypothetical protein